MTVSYPRNLKPRWTRQRKVELLLCFYRWGTDTQKNQRTCRSPTKGLWQGQDLNAELLSPRPSPNQQDGPWCLTPVSIWSDFTEASGLRQIPADESQNPSESAWQSHHVSAEQARIWMPKDSFSVCRQTGDVLQADGFLLSIVQGQRDVKTARQTQAPHHEQCEPSTALVSSTLATTDPVWS